MESISWIYFLFHWGPFSLFETAMCGSAVNSPLYPTCLYPSGVPFLSIHHPTIKEHQDGSWAWLGHIRMFAVEKRKMMLLLAGCINTDRINVECIENYFLIFHIHTFLRGLQWSPEHRNIKPKTSTKISCKIIFSHPHLCDSQ